MADRFRGLISSLPEAAEDPAATAVSRRVWVPQVLGIWLVARLITTVWLLFTQSQLLPTSRGATAQGFFGYSTLWDGQWYWLIGVTGYPSTLPVNLAGHVEQNQWAFMPVYPFVSSAVAALTGVGWPVAGTLVAIAFGFGSAVVLYQLFRARISHGRALFAVALTAVGPASFIFQMAYAESMGLFFVALALLFLQRRRWGSLAVLIPVMALTRPSGLAFALALLLYFGGRYLRRDRDPFPRRERWNVGAMTVFSGIMGFAWAGIAWAVTGSPTAYTDTELAWRSDWIGQVPLVPFSPWFEAAPFWVGYIAGPIVVIAIVIGFVALLLTPRVRALGMEMHAWVAAYGVYLLAVFFPQSSLIRLLIPMFPLAAAFAPARSKAFGVALLGLALAGQLAWLWFTWGPVTTWWSVP